MTNLLEDLNEAQREAVECTDGPVMVLAGAGSGKTRVLTYKVAYLLSKGVDPFSILALTFTNKAAREMKSRIIGLVGPGEAKNVWMGTFHAIFARILRVEGYRLGYPPNFTIYDTDDCKTLIKQIIKDQQLDDKAYPVNLVLSRISGSKTRMVSSQEYNTNAEIQQQDKSAGKIMMGTLYTLYEQRLNKASAMDFDDLLYKMNILLSQFPDVLYKYQQMFQYILVDEYQDTNFAQYLIIKKLAANNENICVVGDDAQSIYAFRGANIQNILNLKYDYPDIKTFKLEQNYRSTQNIVKAASSIIANNRDQIKKDIWTQNEEGDKIHLLKSNTDNEEGMLVANEIFELKMQNQLPHLSFAILYRINSQSRAMEEALRKLNIPYRIFGGLSFYKRKEIKDLISYFRLAVNQRDEGAFFRVINYPIRGIGKTTTEKLSVLANEKQVSVWEICESIDLYSIGAASARIRDFVTMIQSFAIMAKSKNAYETAVHIAKSSGIFRDLSEDTTPEGVSRTQNIEELLNAINEFTEKAQAEELQPEEQMHDKLEEFTRDIALLTDAENPDKGPEDYVSLMTIHAAKGLEFPYVFLVGVEENMFPSVQSLNSRADLEEERRLFYVALTRAMKRVTLSYSDTRYRWGSLYPCEPSRFIQEVDSKYMEMPKQKTASFSNDLDHYTSRPKPILPNTIKPAVQQTIFNKKLTPVNRAVTKQTTIVQQQYSENLAEALQTGMQVAHDKFGNGKVLTIEGNGENKKALVFFEKIGQKQLLLKFAKLVILNN
jgi:DNA helicase II / ATP-dependent DNA helicase PcrA